MRRILPIAMFLLFGATLLSIAIADAPKGTVAADAPKVAAKPAADAKADPQLQGNPKAKSDPQAKAAPSFAAVFAVFKESCLSCHSAKEAEGGLVLESYESLLKGGDDGAAIVAGASAKSAMVQQLRHAQKPFMPPPKKAPALAADKINLIAAWIDAGATAPTKEELVLMSRVDRPRILPVKAPAPAIYALAATPAGDLLAVGRHGQASLIIPQTQTVLRTFEGLKGNINALAFSRDGKLLACAGGEPGVAGRVDLFRVSDGALVKSIDGHKDALYAVAISPDGGLLATAGYDQRIRLWKLPTGEPLAELEGHNACVTDLAFRPDGKVLASASADRTVKLWSVPDGKRLDTLSESAKELNALAFSPDGAVLVAGGADNRIRGWTISPSAQEGTNKIAFTQFAHEGAVVRLAYSPDGATLLSCADDRTATLWDAKPLKLRIHLPAQPDAPTGVAFVAGGAAVAVGRIDGSLAFLSAKDGAAAAPPKPEAASLAPRALQRGKRGHFSITGPNAGAATLAKASIAGVVVANLRPTRADAVEFDLDAPADAPLGPVEVVISSPAGAAAPLALLVDNIAVHEAVAADSAFESAMHSPTALPATFGANFGRRGEAYFFAFDAKKGQALVVDIAAARIKSKSHPVVAVLDAAGAALASADHFDDSPEALLLFSPPADGRYVLRVTDAMLDASPAHCFQAAVGPFAVATGAFPMSMPPDDRAMVMLRGVNMPASAAVEARSHGPGAVALAVDPGRFRTRGPLRINVAAAPTTLEREPNDAPAQANPMSVPGLADGVIDAARGGAADADLFRFAARRGQAYAIETAAARRGSPADTRIEVLHTDGTPVTRLYLRAVRDTSITFRSIESNNVGARLVHYEEMELNQFLYMNGEVVRLFQAPRGPDSEFNFYAIAGKRRCYFDTSAAAHALDEPCYIVEPSISPPETNGLPVFKLNYANDDDAMRQLGADSRLLFTAPEDGDFLVRVSDARGFGGDRFVYELSVRPAKPDFAVRTSGSARIAAGSGQSFTVAVDRMDGFDGPVRVELKDVPAGFIATSPIVVEAGNTEAFGTLYATAGARAPAAGTMIRATASADLDESAGAKGRATTRPVNGLGPVTLAKEAQVSVEVFAREPAAPATRPDGMGRPGQMGPAGRMDKMAKGGAPTTQRAAMGTMAPMAPTELTLAPGQLVKAWVRVERHGYDGIVTFDAQNLPHGVIIADIGLSGVLIPAGQSERMVFLSCAPWVAEQDRAFHMRVNEAGNPTSAPVMLHIRRGK